MIFSAKEIAIIVGIIIAIILIACILVCSLYCLDHLSDCFISFKKTEKHIELTSMQKKCDKRIISFTNNTSLVDKYGNDVSYNIDDLEDIELGTSIFE